jgi:hypothetical protein
MVLNYMRFDFITPMGVQITDCDLKPLNCIHEIVVIRNFSNSLLSLRHTHTNTHFITSLELRDTEKFCVRSNKNLFRET